MAGVPEPSFLIASGLLGKQGSVSTSRWYLCTDSQDDRARWLDIILRCERAAAFKPPVPSSASDSSRTSSRASRAVRPEGGAGPRAPPRQEHFASHLMRVALASASAPALAQLDALVASFLPYSSGPPGSSAGASSSQTAAASGAASHLAASTAGSGPGAAPAAPAPVQRSLSLAAGLESGHLELLARPGDGDLVVTSIEEQYDRAVQCYERYSPHMPSRQRKELQAWAAAIAASSTALSTGSGSSACGPGPSSFSTSLQLLSAKATFVIEVTRCKQSWAERQQRSAQAAAAAGTAPVEWDAAESDIFASPQACGRQQGGVGPRLRPLFLPTWLQEVVRQLQSSLAMQAGNVRPDAAADEEGSQKSASAAVLHAKDCLDYCNTHWADLFCRLQGPALLLQASLRLASPPSPRTHTQGHLYVQGC
ncbi:hypothetical protein QJQ45_015919 [Haematococcus lacustris]|nr:hypothetical protein QJQ45_015919 [Haematococcus lacustris]